MTINKISLFNKKKPEKQKEQAIRKRHKKITTIGSAIASVGVLSGFLTTKDTLSIADSKKVADTMIENSKLKDKNFKYFFLEPFEKPKKTKEPQNIQFINKSHKETLSAFNRIRNKSAGYIVKKFPFLKKGQSFIKKVAGAKLFQPFISVKIGLNAFYEWMSNTAISPKTKASLMAHEVGHAILYNSSKLAKTGLVLGRILPAIGSGLLLTNAIRNDLNKSDSKSEKIKNFFEKHCAKLTMLSFVPLLIDEGLASTKGLKTATKTLEKTKIVPMKKLYSLGFASYLATAITASLAMRFAKQEKAKLG